MRYITVEIEDGKTTIDAEGFKGEACLKATESLEAALGGEHQREEKPEMRQKAKVKAKVKA